MEGGLLRFVVPRDAPCGLGCGLGPGWSVAPFWHRRLVLLAEVPADSSMSAGHENEDRPEDENQIGTGNPL